MARWQPSQSGLGVCRALFALVAKGLRMFNGQRVGVERRRRQSDRFDAHDMNDMLRSDEEMWEFKTRSEPVPLSQRCDESYAPNSSL